MMQEPDLEPLELDPPTSSRLGKAPATGSDEDGALVYLGDRPTYSCANCSTHLALQDELISKAFSGRDGVAFLFHSAVNIKQGKKEDRMLLTGMHTVADITCMGCGTSVGWTYLKAYETSQKYKEGKFIIEKEKIVKDNAWSLES
ncbi:yippee-domain-containing protein [Calocera viscosa TUFC12733]|uniref:Protein yippee-like n=1 Tax=Calocera viscosa (strain TUFC12733) TaxID=1330018 RepID=A0A167H0N6_CALVF|nr:yippee-domain-containing protein [Calocera viscosa TUFC12733]